MIEVQNLTKFYGQVPAIQDVSFSVEPGEILGFLGPNGAGKTTTMASYRPQVAPRALRATMCSHNRSTCEGALATCPNEYPFIRT